MAFSMGGDSSDHDDNEEMAEINIIPLVMLVLLIIFMVAAPLSIGGINVNLPLSRAKGQKISEDRVVLSINKNGNYYIEKAKIESKSLIEKFKAIFEFRQSKELYIRADRDVAYGRVVDAMTAARLAGIAKMNMLTQKPGAVKK